MAATDCCIRPSEQRSDLRPVASLGEGLLATRESGPTSRGLKLVTRSTDAVTCAPHLASEATLLNELIFSHDAFGSNPVLWSLDNERPYGANTRNWIILRGPSARRKKTRNVASAM